MCDLDEYRTFWLSERVCGDQRLRLIDLHDNQRLLLLCSSVGSWCDQLMQRLQIYIILYQSISSTDSREIIASRRVLCDDRLLNLTRVSETDESLWRESAHDQEKWTAMLEELIRWQENNIVKYENSSLNVQTATGLTLSSDERHVYVVCLNHTFKIWSFDREERLCYESCRSRAWYARDIETRTWFKRFKSDSNIEDNSDGDELYVMTYSFQDLDQFKIWVIRDSDEGVSGVRDMFSEYTLRAFDSDSSLESKAIWTGWF
jgi:hypothetical protein